MQVRGDSLIQVGCGGGGEKWSDYKHDEGESIRFVTYRWEEGEMQTSNHLPVSSLCLMLPSEEFNASLPKASQIVSLLPTGDTQPSASAQPGQGPHPLLISTFQIFSPLPFFFLV